MPITITYDLKTDGPNRNHPTNLRYMFQYFGFRQFGRSVFRYTSTAESGDDWLNRIVPALMFFRKYLLRNNIELTSFTLDASGTSYFNRDENSVFGLPPIKIDETFLEAPMGTQFAKTNITDWLGRCEEAMQPKR